MAGLCKASIIGNLGGPAELKYTPAGVPLATFNVACNQVTMRDGERHEETDWFRVTAWRKLGETYAPLLNKGSRVYVEGRLKSRTWTGQDGKDRFSMEISADTIVLLDQRQRGESAEGASEDPSAMDANEIPF